MRRIGLIVYREEVKEEFNRVLDEMIAKYNKEKLVKKNSNLGHGNKNKGWNLFQISSKAFRNYSIFDSFLLEFAERTAHNNYILVCGHNDESGFMWMDYEYYGYNHFANPLVSSKSSGEKSPEVSAAKEVEK